MGKTTLENGSDHPVGVNRSWPCGHTADAACAKCLAEAKLCSERRRDAANRAGNELGEWRRYWGCVSPHDSHVQASSSDPYARQLGIEQARANRLDRRVDDLQTELENARKALAVALPFSSLELEESMFYATGLDKEVLRKAKTELAEARKSAEFYQTEADEFSKRIVMAEKLADERRHYLSTACFHDQHQACRRQCKFCSNACRCACHDQTGAAPKKPTYQELEKLAEERGAALGCVVPQTYGEALRLYPWLVDHEGYEWDNRTTLENAAWVAQEIYKETKQWFRAHDDDALLKPYQAALAKIAGLPLTWRDAADCANEAIDIARFALKAGKP